MNTSERIEFFKEDCKSVVSKFRTTLFYYYTEKSDNDFRAFAINEARAKNKILIALHNGAAVMLDETDTKSAMELLDILGRANKKIDETMEHTHTYCEYLDYVKTLQK